MWGSKSMYAFISSPSCSPAADATWLADGAVFGVWRSKMKSVIAAPRQSGG